MAHDNTAYSAEKRCAHCGRLMFILDVKLWAYKIPTSGTSHLWFCCWSCMAAWRREHEKPMKNSRDRKVTRQKYQPGLHPNHIREIREHFGIPREQMTRYLGCSKSTYCHMELGVRRISPERMEEICGAFGCNPEDILTNPFDAAAAEAWECRIKKEITHPTR